MKRALLILAAAGMLGSLGGCVSPDHGYGYGGEGLGTVDGAYYDRPRDVNYNYQPAYVGGGYSAGYYYGWPGYSRPYYGGGHNWHDHDGDDHGGHDHDWHGDDSHHDHDGGGRPPPSPPPAADKPSYNDMRAGKLNPHIHENVGGNRMSNSGGKH